MEVLLPQNFYFVLVEKATSESIEIDEEEVMKTALQLEDGNNDDKGMETEQDENESGEKADQGELSILSYQR